MYVPYLNLFICCWTLSLLPCLGYCKQCFYEHWSLYIFSNLSFHLFHLYCSIYLIRDSLAPPTLSLALNKQTATNLTAAGIECFQYAWAWGNMYFPSRTSRRELNPGWHLDYSLVRSWAEDQRSCARWLQTHRIFEIINVCCSGVTHFMATEKWSSLQSPCLGLPSKCGLIIVSSLDRAAELRTRPWRGPRRGKGGAVVSLRLKSLYLFKRY